jgi:hypothetical protein
LWDGRAQLVVGFDEDLNNAKKQDGGSGDRWETNQPTLIVEAVQMVPHQEVHHPGQ